MKLSLVVMSAGKAAGQTIPITLAQFLIGRDPQCNLRPASSLISKRHCAVLSRNGKVVVRDFDSTNGTFVNDEPVKGEAPLAHNDVLKVGPLAFRVVIEEPAAVNKPTPLPTPAPAAAGSDDESVAAMLLSLQDEGGTTTVGPAASEAEVPAGSTVMEVPSAATPGEEAKPAEAAKPAAKKDEKKIQQNSSLAAKMILEKYTRRQRS